MQFIAFASIRATVVLPVPRGPENRIAWATRPDEIALVKRSGDMRLCDNLFKGLRTILACKDEIGHRECLWLSFMMMRIGSERYVSNPAMPFLPNQGISDFQSCCLQPAQTTRRCARWTKRFHPSRDVLIRVGFDGGERGIRTLGAAFDSTHDFQSCSFSQLGHLSGSIELSKSQKQFFHPGNLFESVGRFIWVDPPGGEGGIRTHDPVFDRILLFESRAFSRSATSPDNIRNQVYMGRSQYTFCLQTVNDHLAKYASTRQHILRPVRQNCNGKNPNSNTSVFWPRLCPLSSVLSPLPSASCHLSSAPAPCHPHAAACHGLNIDSTSSV